jgi:hypothetical protein
MAPRPSRESEPLGPDRPREARAMRTDGAVKPSASVPAGALYRAHLREPRRHRQPHQVRNHKK